MFTTRNTLEIDLRCWDEHHPCSASLYKKDGESKDLIAGGFCDTLSDFRFFIDEQIELENMEIKYTELVFRIDPIDVDSNVFDIARDITEYFRKKIN